MLANPGKYPMQCCSIHARNTQNRFSTIRYRDCHPVQAGSPARIHSFLNLDFKAGRWACLLIVFLRSEPFLFLLCLQYRYVETRGDVSKDVLRVDSGFGQKKLPVGFSTGSYAPVFQGPSTQNGLLDDAQFTRSGNAFCPAAHIHLFKDITDMPLDRSNRQE